MITFKTLQNYLMGTEAADTLIQMLETVFKDFAETKKQYDIAMDALHTEIGSELIPSAEDVQKAIATQLTAALHFSGFLGLKANLDHFINPVAKTFLDAEPELYLQERTVHRLSEYEHAQEILERFYAQLSPKQKEQYEAVVAYICYLETAAPKLAHYYGYLFGNMYLPKVIPGYHADPVLDIQYRLMLTNYFRIDPKSLRLVN